MTVNQKSWLVGSAIVDVHALTSTAARNATQRIHLEAALIIYNTLTKTVLRKGSFIISLVIIPCLKKYKATQN